MAVKKNPGRGGRASHLRIVKGGEVKDEFTGQDFGGNPLRPPPSRRQSRLMTQSARMARPPAEDECRHCLREGLGFQKMKLRKYREEDRYFCERHKLHHQFTDMDLVRQRNKRLVCKCSYCKEFPL